MSSKKMASVKILRLALLAQDDKHGAAVSLLLIAATVGRSACGRPCAVNWRGPDTPGGVSLHISLKKEKTRRKSGVFFRYQVFLMNFSRHLGQVMAILPLPLGTRTVWRHLGQV